MMRWRSLSEREDMKPLHRALNAGIQHLEKYYNLTDNSAANIVNVCTSKIVFHSYHSNISNSVLHL